MSTSAYEGLRSRLDGGPAETPQPVTRNGTKVSVDEILSVVKERRTAAKSSRARYEPIWRLCQAFVAGRQWVGLTKGRDARVVEEPNPKRRERHTANVLTQYFWTAIGKLYDDNFMPNMQFARADFEAEHLTKQAMSSFGFAWDEEVRANEVILDLLVEMVGYGTVASRCRYDGTQGAYLGEVPVDDDGQIIPLREGDGRYEELMKKMTFGEPVDWRVMREGKIRWDVLSPFNLLPPPGIPHERDFPWVIVERPVPLDDVKAMFPDRAGSMVEQNLSQVDLISDRALNSTEDPLGGDAKLRGHVILSTMYERPTRKFEHGRTVYWSDETFLREKPSLEYTINGEPKAGLAFFRYHRVPRRFWGIGLIEPAIGPQRQRNRARSQHIEMKDKNLGRVYARKGTLTESNTPTGKIMELIEVKQNADMPIETAGMSPNQGIADEVAMNDADLEKVMGFRDLVNSESLKGVTAYAAFALQAEQEDKRVGPILANFRAGIVELSRFTAAAMRMYWPTDKHVILAGPDGQIDSFVYNAANMPDEVYFRFGKGASVPRSQAAETQKVFDIYDRSISSGRPLGVEWLMGSLNAGKALPFPEGAQQLQTEKAQLENMLMAQGHPAQVGPQDDHTIHLQEHNLALQQALLFDRQEVAQTIQQHIALHQQAMQTQSQLVSSVPGMQGAMGALGAPQAQAANAGQGLAAAVQGIGGGQLVEGGAR